MSCPEDVRYPNSCGMQAPSLDQGTRRPKIRGDDAYGSRRDVHLSATILSWTSTSVSGRSTSRRTALASNAHCAPASWRSLSSNDAATSTDCSVCATISVRRCSSFRRARGATPWGRAGAVVHVWHRPGRPAAGRVTTLPPERPLRQPEVGRSTSLTRTAAGTTLSAWPSRQRGSPRWPPFSPQSCSRAGAAAARARARTRSPQRTGRTASARRSRPGRARCGRPATTSGAEASTNRA